MTEMKEPIKGKVAHILSSRELALNVGSKNGVEEGMYFEIMNDEGSEIFDPDTDEKLGSVKLVKVRVIITAVKEKLSVASTFITNKKNIGGKGGIMGESDLHQLLSPPKWIEKPETLKSSDLGAEAIDPKDSYVEVGDSAIQVIDADKISRLRHFRRYRR